jgi:hypothetical protein
MKTTRRQRIEYAIGKLERNIARTERVQDDRRALVKRLLDPATSADEVAGIVEFYTDRSIDTEPARERAYTPRPRKEYASQSKQAKRVRAEVRRADKTGRASSDQTSPAQADVQPSRSRGRTR